ncbi:hypothetical protein PF010_g19855 [Phytophthora fragariae]|uniref:Uncharacterized protein n=1 Tax=Phytophthora fragariae TaxID=53985 RepID=A0A6A3J2Z7_9STRA|nr:hypothetical protein PF011_g19053 [Phytophthora fragariae]KAE9087077.1 hypothetical protein PF010_g19855 [Phytophthora fragariae]KAE9216404.1 hypothetical protein PF004_g14455 [Phytophthora fragariae]
MQISLVHIGADFSFKFAWLHASHPSGHRGRTEASGLNQPRRPNTTPKPRIQRLLPAPGQSTAQGFHSSRQSVVPTLVHLPDSPPRMLSMRSSDPLIKAKETSCAGSLDATTTNLAPALASNSCSTVKTDDRARGSGAESVFNFRSVIRNNSDDVSQSRSLIAGSSCSNNNNEKVLDQDCSITNEPESSTYSIEPEQGGDKAECQQDQENSCAVEIIGPLLTDIHSENCVESAEPNQYDRQLLKDRAIEDFDDDAEYRRALANRAQLLIDEANRQRIREELETYVSSLSSRTDENGEHLVEFPRNYQQVLSLMTQKDVSEEDSKSPEGNHSRQSWSRVLIESGLSKQQAFGILEDVDDDPEGNSSMAAKIAFKMARIRQLDTILEEKLGENLYSSIVPRKQKRARSPPQPEAARDTPSRSSMGTLSSRTFVTQTQSTVVGVIASNGGDVSRCTTANEDEVVLGSKKSNNFIERNKQVVANGMKANMTKDEEDRLEKLLRDEAAMTPGSATNNEPVTGDNINADGSARREECNEFTMPDAEKQAIEELIASKSGTYPLFAIDEVQDGPTDEALPPSDTRPAKETVIQETKRERLQRQRLSRVEQELRFLHESPSVIIVGDDDGDENDDCRSEKSFVTVASSTCSTRSGVISRHDFKCFLVQQKESFRSTPTASADEIRRLLLSISTAATASSNPMTATTG